MNLKDLQESILKNKLDYVLIGILSFIAFINLFHSHLTDYLIQSIDRITLSLGLLTEVRNLLNTTTSHIPLIGSSAKSVADSLTEVIQYLSWSDMLITAQLLLIKISRSIIFKLLLILSIIGSFLPAHRSFSLKAILILLLINPGLPAYVTVVKYISQEIKLDDGAVMHNQIQQVHQKYQKKEAERKEKESKRNQRQLQKAQEHGKQDISGLKKLEDKVVDDVATVTSKVGEGFAEGIAIVKSAGKELTIKSINFIVTVAVQFLVLPFVFFYGVLLLIKHFATGTTSEVYLQKITVGLFLGVLISASTLLFADNPGKSQKPEGTNQGNGSDQVLGIDVSHFQDDVNWEEIKQAGISFAYSKATQGTSYVDPKFARNWSEIKPAGLVGGTYHFYLAGEDPKVQAELFIKTVGKIEEGDMPPMLDLEEAGMKPGIDPKKYQENLFIWLDLVEKAFSRKPIIYTDHPYGNKYLTDPKFGEYGLWIADWEKRTEPRIPQAWKGKWVIWQRSDKGKIEGAIGDMDHDLFNGTRKEFHGFIKR